MGTPKPPSGVKPTNRLLESIARARSRGETRLDQQRATPPPPGDQVYDLPSPLDLPGPRTEPGVYHPPPPDLPEPTEL